MYHPIFWHDSVVSELILASASFESSWSVDLGRASPGWWCWHCMWYGGWVRGDQRYIEVWSWLRDVCAMIQPCHDWRSKSPTQPHNPIDETSCSHFAAHSQFLSTHLSPRYRCTTALRAEKVNASHIAINRGRDGLSELLRRMRLRLVVWTCYVFPWQYMLPECNVRILQIHVTIESYFGRVLPGINLVTVCFLAYESHNTVYEHHRMSEISWCSKVDKFS